MARVAVVCLELRRTGCLHLEPRLVGLSPCSCQVLEPTLTTVLPFLASLCGLGQCSAPRCWLHKGYKMVHVICWVSVCCDSLGKLSAVSLLSSRCNVYHPYSSRRSQCCPWWECLLHQSPGLCCERMISLVYLHL